MIKVNLFVEDACGISRHLFGLIAVRICSELR